MRTRRWLPLAAVVVLLGGCGSEEDGTVVEMADNAFSPESTTVAVGEEITFDNVGQIPHNALDVDGAWSTGDVRSGDAETIVIDEPGSYTYYCSFHAPEDASGGMVGTLTVTEDGVAAEPGAGDAETTPIEAVEPTGEVRRVPGDYPTIQSGVDAAEPGDLVLVEPGRYREQVTITTEQIVLRGADRNEVVIDGEFEREMGVMVTADGVAVENLTVREVTGNGVYFDGVTGFRGSHLTSINSGTYGIYAFDSSDGLFEHSYASGSADGGFYVGQCEDCRTVLYDVTAEHNAFGFSGTNANNSLYLVGSTWRHNGAGIVPNTLDSQRFPPSRGATIAGNLVESNGNYDAPTLRVTWPAFGNGILLAGGVDHHVHDNVVRDHPGYGIATSPNIDRNFWRAAGNEIRDNVVEGSGQADLASVAPSGRGGDCFEGNQADRTLPRTLQRTRSCDGASVPGLGSFRHTWMLLGTLGQYPGDRLPQDLLDELPEPGELPQLPGGAEAEVRPAVDVFAGFDAVDLDAIERPRPAPGATGESETLVAGFPVARMGPWQAYFAVVGWLLPALTLLAVVAVALVDALRRPDLAKRPGTRVAWAGVLGACGLAMLVTWWPATVLLALGTSWAYLLWAAPELSRRTRWLTVGGSLATLLLVVPALVVAGALMSGVL